MCRGAQGLPKLVGREGDLVVVGVELVGDTTRVVELVLLVTLEADRVSMDLTVSQLLHAPHDRRGIQTSAEKHAQWPLRHQVPINGLLELFPYFFFPVAAIGRVSQRRSGFLGD